MAAIGMAMLLPGPALTCIGDNFDSIHFHSGSVDFGRVPRRARIWEADDRHVEEAATASRTGIELEDLEDREEEHAANRVRMLKRADNALIAGRTSEAGRLYRQALARFGKDGTLFDRIEIASRLSNQARLSPALRQAAAAYMHAVPFDHDERAFDASAANTTLLRLANDRTAGFLQEHALYQAACLAYHENQRQSAVGLYQQQIGRFRRSTKTEAGLIMLARCALLDPAPTESGVAAGIRALQRLDRIFPRSRYHRASFGLWGRALFLHRRYRQALDCYYAVDDAASIEIVRKAMAPVPPPPELPARLMAAYLRQLTAAGTMQEYAVAIRGINQTRASFSPADAGRFARLLRRDVTLPAPYFYYRLYHTEMKPREVARLAQLARDVQLERPAAKLPPIVLVRFGEIAYFRKRWEEAREWADRALSADRERSDATPRALYVRGASAHKLRRYQEAITDFASLLRRQPTSPLVRGAREELAILREATGDLESALDQYFELGYQADIAFFLDGRMTTEQVEHYLRTRPDRAYTNRSISPWRSPGRRDIPRQLRTHDLIRYALGVRYMRTEQWTRAAALLRQFPGATYMIFSRGRHEWDYESEPSPDPLSAIRALSQLQKRIAAAKTSDARAEAMYRYAGYYYSHGALLLYAPPLWLGEREAHFQFYWNKSHATPEDERAATRYMQEHEIYSHAMRIYEQIPERYPKSPYAPKALYRAACAAYHQSNFNEWWRERDKRFRYQAKASRLMATLARRYPHHPLAAEAKKYASVFRVASNAIE